MPSMILLYNGATSGGKGHVLKAESFSMTLAKTAIQVAVPNDTPALMDLNMIRPNLTIGGIVENTVPVGSDYSLPATATTDGDIATGDPTGTGVRADSSALNFDGTYTHPDKATLEYFFYTKAYTGTTKTCLIVLNPDGTTFSFYSIAGQTATFILAPGTEDRYSYSLTFAGGLRNQMAGD